MAQDFDLSVVVVVQKVFKIQVTNYPQHTNLTISPYKYKYIILSTVEAT